MILKVVVLFLIVIGVMAMFGKLRIPKVKFLNSKRCVCWWTRSSQALVAVCSDSHRSPADQGPGRGEDSSGDQ